MGGDEANPAMIRALLLVTAVLLLVALQPPSRVSIVRPVRFVQEHQYLRYQIQIDPQSENAALVVAAVDGDVVRSTREQLDGESAPRTRWIEWKHGLPAGEYTVVAVLFNSSREVARASTELSVMARF